jgi:hypothetical protein
MVVANLLRRNAMLLSLAATVVLLSFSTTHSAAFSGKSELTNAQRTILKRALQEALSNANYVETSDGFGGGPVQPLIVLNVPANEEDFHGEFDRLAAEVLAENPTVYRAFYARLQRPAPDRQPAPGVSPGTLHERVIPASLFSSPYDRENPFPAPGLSRGPAPRPPGDLAHPDWYLGFWRETRIDIAIDALPPYSEPTVVHVNAKFGATGPSLSFDVLGHLGSKEISTYRHHMPPWPLPWPDYLAHRTNPTAPLGLLIVWNARDWQGRWVYDPELQAHYVDPDLFKHITFEFQANRDATITSIQIISNDEEILSNSYLLRCPAHRVVEYHTDADLAVHRRGLLDWKPSPEQASVHAPFVIPPNPTLDIAAQEIGNAWSRKYGQVWGRELAGWDPHPGDWCGRFPSWAFGRAGLLKKAVPQDPWPDNPWYSNAHAITDWFIRNHRYYFPNPIVDIRDQYGYLLRRYAGPQTPYAKLGEAIQPGFYTYMRGHAGIFLYWLQPPDDPVVYRGLNVFSSRNRWSPNQTKEKIFDILDNHVPKVTDPPGRFHSDYDINFFRVMCGNAGNHVAASCFGAVIHLSRWDPDLVQAIIDKRPSQIIPWFDEGDGYFPVEWRDPQRHPEVVTGFGRTDGRPALTF